ncbi:MAG: T9SS type A sorting domain-containing protein [Burkholderiales bacterium]|nr:T9SS type A sorting domain-containing protein [Bacteroidia bacterium]
MKKFYSIFGLLISLNISSQSCNVICNGGFDSTNIAGSTVALISATVVPCWKTTSPDNKMEVWSNGYGGINSYSGIQFIEINATAPCTVYEDFLSNAGSVLSISFAHRARGSGGITDTVQVSVGPQGGPYTSLGKFGDGASSWVYRTLNYTVPAGVGSNFSLRFTAVYAGNGNPAIGNFLDAVKVCSSPVGMEEYEMNSSFVVAPNPCNNDFNIKLLNPKYIGEELSLKLYDVQGKIVKEYVKNTNSQFINFDIKGLSKGIYHYQGNVAGQNFTGKISVSE